MPVGASVTWLGNFLKFLRTNFHQSSPNIVLLLGHFEKYRFVRLNCCCIIFEQLLGYFLFPTSGHIATSVAFVTFSNEKGRERMRAEIRWQKTFSQRG